jgi:hypothetical protein
MDAQTRWTVNQIAAELGFGVQAVKKWRGHTIRALRAAGQLGSVSPTVPLPTNALPIPCNQREHVINGDHPRWSPAVILAWAETTSRRNKETGATEWPDPPGRTPDANKPPGVRRRALANAA